MPDTNPPPPQPLEIPWARLGTTREVSSESLEGDRPQGPTITIYQWESQDAAQTPARRLIYYKIAVSLEPNIFDLDEGTSVVELLDDHTNSSPARVADLYLRLHANVGKVYFVDASPRRRRVTEQGTGSYQVQTSGSTALAVGKSQSTLHDSTTTSLTTTTDPGTGWNIDLGVLSIGGSGDTTQTTSGNTTHDSSQNIDVTQRNASDERSELYDFTTRLTNTLSTLDVFHLGSSDLRFTLWAPPISDLPRTIPNSQYQAYTEALRWRSSGLTGVQEFIAVAVAEPGARVCIEALLDCVYVWWHAPKLASPTSEDVRDLWWKNHALGRTKVLDYLERKYPLGFPADELDVDLSGMNLNSLPYPVQSSELTDFQSSRSATIDAWEVPNEIDKDDEDDIFVKLGLSGLFNATNITGYKILWPIDLVPFNYKPVVSVLLAALQEEYQTKLADVVAGLGMLPYHQSLTLRVCQEEPEPHRSLSPIEMLRLDRSSPVYAGTTSQQLRAFDREIGSARLQRAGSVPATAADDRVRLAALRIAFEENSTLSVDTARDLGFSQDVVDQARRAGWTTMGRFVQEMLRQQAETCLQQRSNDARERASKSKQQRERKIEAQRKSIDERLASGNLCREDRDRLEALKRYLAEPRPKRQIRNLS